MTEISVLLGKWKIEELELVPTTWENQNMPALYVILQKFKSHSFRYNVVSKNHNFLFKTQATTVVKNVAFYGPKIGSYREIYTCIAFIKNEEPLAWLKVDDVWHTGAADSQTHLRTRVSTPTRTPEWKYVHSAAIFGCVDLCSIKPCTVVDTGAEIR